MKSDIDLIRLKKYVDSLHNNQESNIIHEVKELSEGFLDNNSSLAYCYKSVSNIVGQKTYTVFQTLLGHEGADLRILLHEYGHIYLGHLEENHLDLDIKLNDLIENHRDIIVEDVCKTCGLPEDAVENLLLRIIDDPSLNHKLHNIAMDMEINSSIIDRDDLDLMEQEYSKVLLKYEEDKINSLPDGPLKESMKKGLEEQKKNTLVKFIHPTNYVINELGDNKETFPVGEKYPDYLLMIVQRLDLFIKMLASIETRGSTDTSGISKKDIQDALQRIADKNKSEEYKKGQEQAREDIKNMSPEEKQGAKDGYSDSLENKSPRDLSDKSEDYKKGYQRGRELGNNNPGQPEDQQGQDQGNQTQQGQGSSEDFQRGYNDEIKRSFGNQSGSSVSDGNSISSQLSDLINSSLSIDNDYSDQTSRFDSGDEDLKRRSGNGDKLGDHYNESREEADKIRETTGINSWCSKSRSNVGVREVVVKDKIQMALEEVFRKVKTKAVVFSDKKDNLVLYNRGIVKSVLCPHIYKNVTIDSRLKVVFLVDISGSMDVRLVDRIINTISDSLKILSRGSIKYDIITWNTHLGEHRVGLVPGKPLKKISYGGGTDIAAGIEYFRNNYDRMSTLVIISDFEDNLDEWHRIEKEMNGYNIYGFNYGSAYNYFKKSFKNWKNLKERKFNE